jgi:hypothetical protein
MCLQTPCLFLPPCRCLTMNRGDCQDAGTTGSQIRPAPRLSRGNMPYNAMIDWVHANYAYGHLDEMPDDLLSELLRDRKESEVFAWNLFARCSPSKPVAAILRVRKWLVIERLRRLGKLGTFDVLVKEMSRMNHGNLTTPDGKPLGEIVEVSTGTVMIVGEEISLCEKSAP